MNSNDTMCLSVVVPCYNEEANIEKLYEEITKAIRPLGITYEIILVNDGSSDATEKCILDLSKRDNAVKCLSFAVNYGHQIALMEGLRRAKGETIISMDADLQTHPRYIPELITAQEQSRALIVEAKRGKNQQSGFFKNIFSTLYNIIFKIFTGIQLEPGVADYRLYTRLALDAICQEKSDTPFIRGQISQMRIPKCYIEYNNEQRAAGIPAYTFKKSFMLAYYSLLSYSKLPYRLGLFVSIMFMVLALFLSLQYAYLRFFTDNYVPGDATIIILMSLGFSLVLLVCSLILRYVYELLGIVKGKTALLIKKDVL